MSAAAVVVLPVSLKVVHGYERAVVFRLGRELPIKRARVLGKADLDALLAERGRLNEDLQQVLFNLIWTPVSRGRSDSGVLVFGITRDLVV